MILERPRYGTLEQDVNLDDVQTEGMPLTMTPRMRAEVPLASVECQYVGMIFVPKEKDGLILFHR